jgi:signal transduction histidine kinase/PAS domain-containing protein
MLAGKVSPEESYRRLHREGAVPPQPPSSTQQHPSSALAQAEGKVLSHLRPRPPFTFRRISIKNRQGKSARLPRRVWRWFAYNSFAPEWFPTRWQHRAYGYLAAIIVQIVAIVLDMLLGAVLPTPPFRSLLPILGVVVVALGWGAAPGIVSIVVGALLLDYFLVPPALSFLPSSPEAVASIGLLIVVGGTISLLASQTERARRALDTERASLESIFQTITDGVLVTNAEGTYLRANSAFRDLLGLDADPQFSSRPAKARKRLLNPHNEQGRPLTDEEWPIFRLLRGETLEGKDAVDFMAQTLDGREVFASASGAPLRDRLGKLTGAVMVLRDVTERGKLERRTREALEALLAMAESLVRAPAVPSGALAPVGAAAPNDAAQRLVELTRRVLGCQRATIVAIEPETERQLPVAAMGFSPEEEHYFWNEQSKLRLDAHPDPTLAPRLRAGALVVLDMTSPLYQNQPNPYQARSVLVAPMRMSGQLIGILALDYDQEEHLFSAEEMALAGAVGKLGALVLERERLLREREEARANELALREANRHMDEFLNIASHELKTPLTSIRTSIQLLRRRVAGLNGKEANEHESAGQRVRAFEEMLSRTDRQTGQLSRLVEYLLDVSRIQTGRLDLFPVPTDLAALVRETVQQHAQLMVRRTLHLSFDAQLAVPVAADAERIRQVLRNYLTNALKYSSETSPVEIGLEVQERRAQVWVRDHGPGLPLAEQEHIWGRFQRARGIQVQSGSGVGLGIGLYISRAIIERHQGQVGVQSAPGKGSTFWFSLPLAEPADTIPPANQPGD